VALVTTTTTSPPLDETTTIAIREALGSAQMGRLDEACLIVERALARGGDRIALNALLGMLRMDTGDMEAAVRSLEVAHAARPSDLRIATNLSTALSNIGNMERVLLVASRDRAFADPTNQLARIRGYAADQMGQWDEAIDAYAHVVASASEDWASWNNLGNARVMAGDAEGGIPDLERALSMAADSPPIRLNLARAYRRSGEWQKSEQILRQMAAEFPDDAKPLIDLHDLLKMMLREDEILEVVDRALAIEPDNVELLLARAHHFGNVLDMEKGEDAFRVVLQHDPRNVDAFVGLATLFEHSRPAALEALAVEAERKGIDGNGLNLVRAFAHRRAKRFADGVADLNKVEPDFESARREHLLGQMLEGLGDYDGAFAAFQRMNEVQAQDVSQPLERAEATRNMLRQQLGDTTSEWFASWSTASVEPDHRSPVFLVGFPRSGTTLLDTILMGHPETVVMEERPVISRLKGELGGFEAIASLDRQAIRDAQRRYFEIAGEYADLGAGGQLIDKSPLLMNEAAFIHRLFPSSPFLLAIRHPADVLLSCYVSNFNLNDSMANFLRLDTAAEFYDLAFQSWENARGILPLTVHRVTYEEMVEDPPAILRPIVEALHLQWHEDMLDHRKTAAERGLISTASYAQVTEPIYRRSVGRWLNYRKHLEPVLPVLAPWTEKLGYTI
jgi:tetratricopeptide (TPR) repeat protein